MGWGSHPTGWISNARVGVGRQEPGKYQLSLAILPALGTWIRDLPFKTPKWKKRIVFFSFLKIKIEMDFFFIHYVLIMIPPPWAPPRSPFCHC